MGRKPDGYCYALTCKPENVPRPKKQPYPYAGKTACMPQKLLPS